LRPAETRPNTGIIMQAGTPAFQFCHVPEGREVDFGLCSFWKLSKQKGPSIGTVTSLRHVAVLTNCKPHRGHTNEINLASSWRPVPPRILLLVVLKPTTERWMRHGTAQRPGRPITQANVTRAADLLPSMPPRLASRVKYQKLWTFRFKSHVVLSLCSLPGPKKATTGSGQVVCDQTATRWACGSDGNTANKTKVQNWFPLKPFGHSYLHRI
jgi:hypothetical protein